MLNSFYLILPPPLIRVEQKILLNCSKIGINKSKVLCW